MRGLIYLDSKEKQEYTVKECLDILNISKATFYSRINLNKDSLNQYISMKNGKKYITSEGLEFIKCLNNIPDSVQTVHTVLDDSDKRIMDLLKEQIDELKKDKERLFTEIDIKNRQIEDQNRMLENNQVIIQQSQQKIFFLESEEQKKIKMSWWKRIFE